MSLWRSIRRICFSANNLNLTKPNCRNNACLGLFTQSFNKLDVKNNGIHTTCTRRDLMEFFDDPKNWAEVEVLVGRSWKVEELRIKSNSDLHKLWYVLLKEKNMLLTMHHEYERQQRSFPNPERLDKVEESMENLETVVRERNRAYFELETGETGERPTGVDTNCFGLKYKFKKRQFPIEKKYNWKFQEYKKSQNYTDDHKYVQSFLEKLAEKKRRRGVALKHVSMAKACELMEKFPNLDEEALQNKFPGLDIEDVKKDLRSRGPHENKY